VGRDGISIIQDFDLVKQNSEIQKLTGVLSVRDGFALNRHLIDLLM
jgi:hypothetical protein